MAYYGFDGDEYYFNLEVRKQYKHFQDAVASLPDAVLLAKCHKLSPPFQRREKYAPDLDIKLLRLREEPDWLEHTQKMRDISKEMGTKLDTFWEELKDEIDVLFALRDQYEKAFEYFKYIDKHESELVYFRNRLDKRIKNKRQASETIEEVESSEEKSEENKEEIKESGGSDYNGSDDEEALEEDSQEEEAQEEEVQEEEAQEEEAQEEEAQEEEDQEEEAQEEEAQEEEDQKEEDQEEEVKDEEDTKNARKKRKRKSGKPLRRSRRAKTKVKYQEDDSY